MKRDLKSKRISTTARCIIYTFLLLPVANVHAAVFTAQVSPPTFELFGKPGDVIREVVEIHNPGSDTAQYRIRTADWSLTEQGGVIIRPESEGLASNSCRPWSRIERRKLVLRSQAKKRYRFEVHIPQTATGGECRFAILIAPEPGTVDPVRLENFEFPVTGRLAVIVYVAVGNAAPELAFEAAAMKTINGVETPVLRFHNRGNAHARPGGSVRVKDATGKTAELIAVPFPILPGKTVDIALRADPEISGIREISELTLPFQLNGRIEWRGGSTVVDTTLHDNP